MQIGKCWHCSNQCVILSNGLCMICDWEMAPNENSRIVDDSCIINLLEEELSKDKES